MPYRRCTAGALPSRDMDLKRLIRTVPDYPKPGVMVRDITTLLKDPAGFRATIDAALGLPGQVPANHS